MKYCNLQSASTLTRNSALCLLRCRGRMRPQCGAMAKALWNVNYVRLLKQFWSERGYSLVELAVVMPILLVLFTSIVELGRMAYAATELSKAANGGTLCGPHNLFAAMGAASLQSAPLKAASRRKAL
jgi:hypothetical protein